MNSLFECLVFELWVFVDDVGVGDDDFGFEELLHFLGCYQHFVGVDNWHEGGCGDSAMSGGEFAQPSCSVSFFDFKSHFSIMGISIGVNLVFRYEIVVLFSVFFKKFYY